MIPGVGGWIFWVIIWVWTLPLIQCRLTDVRSWKLWHIKWKPLFGFKQSLFCPFCHKTFPAPSPCAQHKMQLQPLQTNISFLPFYVIWMSFYVNVMTTDSSKPQFETLQFWTQRNPWQSICCLSCWTFMM